MRRYVLIGRASALCAGAAWAAADAAKTPQQLVDARVTGMKDMGGNVKGASKAATVA